MPLPQILDYLDYREWLKTVFDSSRDERSWFSLRYLGNRLGLDAGNLVKILQKSRHLPSRCIYALAKELELNAREREYLGLLLEFGKAGSPAKAKVAYERLLDLKYVRPEVVGKDQYAFYRDWKPTAVLALLHLPHIQATEAGLAQHMVPTASTVEVAQSLQVLERLGMVSRSKAGRWMAERSLLTTGEGWKDLAVREFQRQTLRLAENALQHVEPDLREISTVTVTLGSKDLDKVRELAREFRRAVLQLASENNSPDRVYQVNLQCFPLSQPVVAP